MGHSQGAPWDPEQEYIQSTVGYWARVVARRHRLTRQDKEDFKQDLLLDLLRRLRLFDARRASRRTFISRVAAHRAVTLIEHRYAQVRDPRMVALSLDEPLDWADGDPGTYADVVDTDGVVGSRPDAGSECQRKILLRIELEAALKDLPPELQELCVLLGEGRPVQEIARRQGLHRDTVDRHRAKVRKILRGRGLGPKE